MGAPVEPKCRPPKLLKVQLALLRHRSLKSTRLRRYLLSPSLFPGFATAAQTSPIAHQVKQFCLGRHLLHGNRA